MLSTYFQCTRRSGHRTFPRTPLSENRNFRCSRLLSSAPGGDPLLEWRKPRSTTWIDSKLRYLDDCGISEAYYHTIHTFVDKRVEESKNWDTEPPEELNLDSRNVSLSSTKPVGACGVSNFGTCQTAVQREGAGVAWRSSSGMLD